MAQQSEHSSSNSFPGDVLVAASGFIVTAGAWMLFGFLEGEFTASSSATIFFVLALAHGLAGVMVFGRRQYAVPAAVTVALIGLIIAGFSPQYVLVFTNCVIILLVLLARGNVTLRSIDS